MRAYDAAMGRGELSKRRWKNDRIKKKKARDRRKAQARGAERAGTGPDASES